MKSQSDVEQILARLGSEWPTDDSLVNRVMRDIQSQSIQPELRRVKWPLLKPLLATAASLAIACALWWTFHARSTLYAQVVDGIRAARSFHMTATARPEMDKPAELVWQSWYVRDVGFREDVDPKVWIGNHQDFWTYVKGSRLASRWRSHSIDAIVDRVLNNEPLQLLKRQQTERFPAGDQQLDGRPCKAYLATTLRGVTDPDWQAGKKRMIFLLDDRSRLVRAVTEFRTDDRWVAQYTMEWKYDVPVDPALFEPRFGDDVKIVDADAVFDEFVDLQTAMYREERSGLWFAIHDAQRFEGGILVVSSVRGTAETLKKFPLTPRLSYVDGPAVNYEASPQGIDYFRIELASANLQGVNVSWAVFVPRGTPPTHFDVGPGKVKLPIGITPHGEFAKAHFANARGVINHLTWDITLDLPEPKPLPTLDAIARRVYADQVTLAAVPFRQLDMGPKDNVKQFSEPDKTTAAEFSTAVATHVRWWMENDVEFQLKGQFANPSPQYVVQSPEDWPAIGLAYEPTVDDATLIRVAEHPSLKRLYLNGTKITDAGMKHLAGLKELRELSLADTSITDAGLTDLEGLAALRNLNVRGTKVTAAGVARLKAANPALQIEQ